MTLYVHSSGERVVAPPESTEGRRLEAASDWRRVPDPAPVDTPAESDLKDAWISFALARGVPSYEVHNMTKDELIERCGDG